MSTSSQSQPDAQASDSQPAEISPVGFYCDHSDEPYGSRTHYGWEWDEVNGGHTFEHMPNTISSHTGPGQEYLKLEDRDRRCPRAEPVYAVDAPALTVEINRLRAGLEPYEMLTAQQCENGKHADWLVDSENNHRCPWCRIAALEAERAGAEAQVREAVAQDFVRQGKASNSLSWGQAVYIARDGLCGCSGGLKPCDMGKSEGGAR